MGVLEEVARGVVQEDDLGEGKTGSRYIHEARVRDLNISIGTGPF